MSTLVIQHLDASELPQDWAVRLPAKPGQTVTVRIETEPEQPVAEAPVPFVTEDPSFGIWRDRQDIADVDGYARRLRTCRCCRY